jgi:hypothetical protein
MDAQTIRTGTASAKSMRHNQREDHQRTIGVQSAINPTNFTAREPVRPRMLRSPSSRMQVAPRKLGVVRGHRSGTHRC